MSVANSADEKLIEEVVAAVRRAMEHARNEGRAEALDQIKRFVSDGVPKSSAGASVKPRLRILRKPGTRGSGPRKYPYGFVTGNVTQALRDNPTGLTREGIKEYCATVLNGHIDEASIRNTLKQFIKDKKAGRSSTGLYIPGPAL